MRPSALATVLCAVLLVCGPGAYALINPNFTPVQLVEKADQIWVVQIQPPDENGGRCVMCVVKSLKGRMPANRQILDLTRAANQEHARAVRRMLAEQKGEPALFFAGKGERDEPLAMLHVRGKWVSLGKAAPAAAKAKVGTPDS